MTKAWSNRFWRDTYSDITGVFTCNLFESNENRKSLCVLSYKEGGKQAKVNIVDKSIRVSCSDLESAKRKAEQEVVSHYGMGALNE